MSIPRERYYWTISFMRMGGNGYARLRVVRSAVLATPWLKQGGLPGMS